MNILKNDKILLFYEIIIYIKIYTKDKIYIISLLHKISFK